MASVNVNDEVVARFNAKVRRRDGDGCWEWAGNFSGSGYGVLGVGGKKIYAHRLSYRIAHGGWPNVMVCHRCDNPKCVRPDHLFLGNGSANQRDRHKKARKSEEKFPLWFHSGSGQWAKKINGRQYYFGTDQAEALAKYVRERDDLEAGRRPRPSVESITLADLANEFLVAKREAVEGGELSSRTYSEYVGTTDAVVAMFGRARMVTDLQVEDFARLRASLAKRFGAVRLGNEIQRVRTLFKFALDARHIDTPVRFGPAFVKPSRKTIRLERAAKGSRLITAEDARRLIAEAGTPLDAMILLALNCGFGQGDCSELPRSALSRPGWVIFPRPKTGMPRRAPLWAETQAALSRVQASRPEARDSRHDGLVFLTRFGRPFVRFTDAGPAKPGARTDGIGQEFAKLTARLGISITGGFYTLRHVHRTVADGAKDQVAAGLIMGHVDDSMAGVYRETVDDSRLEAVCEHVRAWLMTGESLWQ